MKKIDFTVLIAVFNNKADSLIESVFSVHKSRQTLDQDYEIVIVDDGSTEEETCHALEYLKIALGVKVLHHHKNMGTSAALNTGHDFIKTEYIALQGSTDISYPNRFELLVNHLINHPEIDVLGTNLASFKESDIHRVIILKTSHAYTTTLEERTEGWLTNHGTVMYKNQSVKDVGGYTKQGRAQDVDLWKRMALAGKKIHTLANITYAWRKANI